MQADTVRKNSDVICILFLAFVIRYLLSGDIGYWADEFLSVLQYGVKNGSSIDVVKRLGQISVHPPLYFFILSNWMNIFGNQEISTHFLSNIYVLLSTLCLYILSLRIYGRRIAIGTSLIFSLMHMPIKYSLESRPYAQTLFLAT